MGCSSAKEKIEDKMMDLQLIRTEIQMDRENLVNKLSEIEGKKIEYNRIPDFMSPQFALGKRIYQYGFLDLEGSVKETNMNTKTSNIKKAKKKRSRRLKIKEKK